MRTRVLVILRWLVRRGHSFRGRGGGRIGAMDALYAPERQAAMPLAEAGRLFKDQRTYE